MKRARLVLLAFSLAALSGCRAATFVPRVLARSVELSFQDIRPVQNRLSDPVRKDAGLAVLWVGHATALIQLEDKLVLTDPVFTDTIGQISKRLVEPGLDPERLPAVDLVLISHMHFDHLSLGSLERIESKVRHLLVPQRGLVYVPGFSFPSSELASWASFERDGLRVTAVPVRHNGFRYGLDGAWMTTSYTGYVIEYRGHTVYFGGDTGYSRGFVETARRFPKIDLALLPIAPIEPRDFMCKAHLDPPEAVRAFLDIGARTMVPIHYDTFVDSTDDPGQARTSLRRAAQRAGVETRVAILEIGEQRVFAERAR